MHYGIDEGTHRSVYVHISFIGLQIFKTNNKSSYQAEAVAKTQRILRTKMRRPKPVAL